LPDAEDGIRAAGLIPSSAVGLGELASGLRSRVASDIVLASPWSEGRSKTGISLDFVPAAGLTLGSRFGEEDLGSRVPTGVPSEGGSRGNCDLGNSKEGISGNCGSRVGLEGAAEGWAGPGAGRDKGGGAENEGFGFLANASKALLGVDPLGAEGTLPGAARLAEELDAGA